MDKVLYVRERYPRPKADLCAVFVGNPHPVFNEIRTMGLLSGPATWCAPVRVRGQLLPVLLLPAIVKDRTCAACTLRKALPPKRKSGREPTGRGPRASSSRELYRKGFCEAEQAAIDHGLELVHNGSRGPDNKPIVGFSLTNRVGLPTKTAQRSACTWYVLDVEDFIHAAYTLEVSSPGVRARACIKKAITKLCREPREVKTHGQSTAAQFPRTVAGLCRERRPLRRPHQRTSNGAT